MAYVISVGGIESISHLFFYCFVTKQVWTGILQWLGVSHVIDSWTTESIWLSRECMKKRMEG